MTFNRSTHLIYSMIFHFLSPDWKISKPNRLSSSVIVVLPGQKGKKCWKAITEINVAYESFDFILTFFTNPTVAGYEHKVYNFTRIIHIELITYFRFDGFLWYSFSSFFCDSTIDRCFTRHCFIFGSNGNKWILR